MLERMRLRPRLGDAEPVELLKPTSSSVSVVAMAAVGVPPGLALR